MFQGEQPGRESKNICSHMGASQPISGRRQIQGRIHAHRHKASKGIRLNRGEVKLQEETARGMDTYTKISKSCKCAHIGSEPAWNGKHPKSGGIHSYAVSQSG